MGSTLLSAMNAIELSIFASRIEAVCDEMGAVLQRTAFSPNIKDRLDYSCAVFDAGGELCAQAAHIPVHLGSMAYAMRGIVREVDWSPGDMVILNDPFLGGTHLPDITLIAPLYVADGLVGFIVNRAHHADIGASMPGSMPISRRLDEEGLIIPPSHLLRAGKLDEAMLQHIAGVTANPQQSRGDFAAQISANRTGLTRLRALVEGMGETGHGVAAYKGGLQQLNDYAERLAQSALSAIPDGEYHFCDWMDDDGCGNTDLPIKVSLHVSGHHIRVDFVGTAAQTTGNINCPLSVAAAGVYYAFRCLMPAHTPAASGSFRSIDIHAPEGCLLNARRPAAVAAGNVETSTRVVDVVLGALTQALPGTIAAASHGSMNNLAMGSRAAGSEWDYYETIGGGMGAGPRGPGLSAVQTHMTNTLNTPIEVLESHYPLRIRRYALRAGSGGTGRHCGGDGLIREFEFLAPTTVTLLTERRTHTPWGLQGGGDGAVGRNLRNGDGLPPKVGYEAQAGERLTVETPGGGGWGS
ncbi:MAG: hydantoinase B/oxoprolinase family protein [Gammaproteobacteria bacterium]|nr:hydantoinase B/oxoprolinase family protein [Gammaproteobacteria bacterium]